MPVKLGESINPAATKRRILTVAERIFYNQGIASVGVAEIADAAGASKASLYKNFGSKEGLVEAALLDRSDRVHRWLRDGLAQLAPGRARVLGLFDLLLDWFADDGFHGCGLVSAAAEQRASDPVVTDLARRHLQAYRELVMELLAEMPPTTAVRLDPNVTADRLLLLIEGATVISAIDGNPEAGRAARVWAESLLDQPPAGPNATQPQSLANVRA